VREPTKATWIRLETDAAFHFDFFLAEKLHLSLAQVRGLPAREWMEWSIYFGRKAQQRELAMMKAK
jgi:hypothetical protein